MKRMVILSLLFVLLAITGKANNVQMTNVSIINNGPGNIQVQFDLSWDNSWRVNTGQNNYDGAWVFFKYKTASGKWTHMTLTGNNNVIPAGFEAYQNSDFQKAGTVIYRDISNMGIGNVTVTGIRLGVINTLPYNITVKGFALEMVYVPPPQQRPYFGDGNGITESTNALHYASNTATTGSVIPMETDPNAHDDSELDADGIYVYSNDTIQKTSPLGNLDPFPTMKALWCMKYEINQAAYRDFLNTLDSQQQANRTLNAPSSATGTGALTTAGTARQFIEIATPAVANTPAVYGCDADGDNVYDEASDGEWTPCGFITWPDIAAFLDWSGLAPMSEIQYEKICRGVSSAGANPALMGEFAWGTNIIHSGTYTLTGAGSANELVANASLTDGNALYTSTVGTIGGPVRSGVFATASSDRATSGATFYGVMEMSGSLWEHVISIGCEAGRSCRYIPNGNGTLSVDGFAQLNIGGAGFWPGMEGNNTLSATTTCAGTCEVTASGGIRLRGGSYLDAASTLAIADRSFTTTPTARAANRGGRGVLYLR